MSELKWHMRQYLFNIQKNAVVEEQRNKKDIKTKYQSGRHKSYLISNHIKCKWTKYSNQKVKIGKMDF